MEKSKLIQFVLIMILQCIIPAALLAEINVAYPPDHSFVNKKQLAIVGTSDETGVIRVQVSGGKSISGNEVPIAVGGFSVMVELRQGSNVIVLTTPSGVTESINLAYGTNTSNYPVWQLHDFQDHFNDCSSCHRVSERRANYKRMAMGEQSCRTDVCHGGVGEDAEFIHGPAAGGVCIACHNPHGSNEINVLTRSGSDQCFICHENKRGEFDLAHQHTPVAKGDCNGCHDPHQSNYRYQLRYNGADLCNSCHNQGRASGNPYLHSPIESGGCTVCHNPHASDFRAQLMAEGNNVCFECHQENADDMNKRHPHPPVEDDCKNCHDPHDGPAPSQLPDKVPYLCWDCHADFQETIDHTTFEHPPAEQGKCGTCHDFHGSDQPRLLKQRLENLCTTCHDEMGETLANNPNRHGPVEDGDCSACHMPHGAFNPRLLVEYFPPEFYNQYREELYSMCFECHNADIARDRETTTLTNFRDGKRNLHYLHINSRKGRSCKACHDVHASDQEKHIRRSVPFGQMYEYPIQYTQTADGGGCLVGCHKPRQYSRSSPKNR